MLNIRGLLPKIWTNKLARTVGALCLLAAIQGCASISRGVTEAILDSGDNVEDRLCQIDGSELTGLSDRMGATNGPTQTMRMLIVHGIGPHSENYSEPFVTSIATKLGMNNREPEQKRIRLGEARRDPFGVGAYGGNELGWMTVTRYKNADASRELLTFEVLWSDYNKESRERLLQFDKDTARLRAPVNDTVKQFFNQQVIDPIKYLGDSATEVRSHVRQAACWMLAGEWDDYPASQQLNDLSYEPCPLVVRRGSAAAQAKAVDVVASDAFVAVTHSLGSRIFLDAFSIQDDEDDNEVNPFSVIGGYLNQKDVTLIMLANQLPLLQQGLNETGFSYPGVPWRNADRYSGRYEQHRFFKYANRDELCLDTDLLRSQRRFRNLNLVSVSDPNDLLSYRLLVGDFVKDYVDWALCPQVTEVLLSVSAPRNVFGLEFADPSKAHGNYWTDGGLAQILVDGFSGENQPLRIATDKRGDLVDLDDENAKVLYNCKGKIYQ